MTNKQSDVSTTSSAYKVMEPRWALSDALLGGTETMRATGKTLLPQHPSESNTNYNNRLERATLLNVYEDTLNTLSGKPFAEDIGLGDDMPPAVMDICEDVDLQGNAIHAFGRDWFRMAWAKGFAHVLVDQPAPPATVDAEGNAVVRTLDDDRKEGVRPYWVLIRPENVLAAYGRSVNGREVLEHVRIQEETIERVGYDEVCVKRIRVLEPGRWELWEEKKGVNNKSEWSMVNEGQTGLDQIPLRTFYAGKKEGLMRCKPPLTDLAHLNITHWQSSSDQRNVLTVARFPILAGKGIEEGSKIEVGPNNFLTSTEGGEWYYVEHTGAAIEAGRKDLEDLENQMAMYGAEFLRKKSGGETATARALDSAENDSELGASAKAFKDVLEEVLQLTADWMNLETGGSVTLTSIDEEPAGAEAPTLDALAKARASRDISRVTYVGELKRRGVLSEDFDADEDEDAMADEKPTDGVDAMFQGGQGPGGLPTPPAQPPVDPEDAD